MSTPGGKKTLRKKLPSKEIEENLVSVPSGKLTNKKSKDQSNGKDESKDDSKKPKK